MDDDSYGDKSNQSSRIFVGGLGDQLGKEDLEQAFAKFGNLKNIWVAQNPPGFAFIEYEDDQDADEAVKEMNGASIGGARLRVEMSRERRGRGRGRGGGGGFRGGFRGGDRGGPRGGRGGFGGGRGSRGSGGGGFRGSRGGGGGYDRPRFNNYESGGSGGGGGNNWGRRGSRGGSRGGGGGGDRYGGSRDYSSDRSGGYESMGSYDYGKSDVSSYRSRSPTGISSHSSYPDQQY